MDINNEGFENITGIKTGIKVMNTLVKEAELPKPIYEETGSSFVVTFKKAEVKEKNRGTLNGTLTEELTEGSKSLYSAVDCTYGSVRGVEIYIYST